MEHLKTLLEEIRRLKMDDIRLYDSRGKSIFADHFIIATSASQTQIEAARNRLIEFMKKTHVRLRNPMEDYHGGWCLLDFGNVIVHLFLEETRKFYDLDSLFESYRFDLESIRVTGKTRAVPRKPVRKRQKSKAKPAATRRKTAAAPRKKSVSVTAKRKKSPSRKVLKKSRKR